MLRRYAPKSLYARVALIVILPIFIMQTMITYVFFDRHWDLVSSNLSASVAGQIALVSRLYAQEEDPVLQRAIADWALDDLNISIRYEPNEAVPATHKLTLFSIYEEALDRELGARLSSPYWINTASWPAYVEVRVQIDSGYLVFLPLRERVHATSGPIFVLWLMGSALLLGWIAIVFLRNQVRSILRLAAAADDFGRGRDAPDFRPAGATEVRRAGHAFIAMRQRIKRHIQQRTTMLAGVSHDLKTPLTRLKLALAMQSGSAEITAMREDVAEMERMLEGYLAFARDMATEEEPGPIDPQALVDEIAQDCARAGRVLSVSVETDDAFTARADALKRALSNLVDNGFKYADNVWLNVSASGKNIEFIIDDDGEGIAPASYDDAFRPFSRLDEARNQNISGVGLGLAVVKDIARSHGGEIELDQSPRGGLRAKLRIPG